MIPKTTTYKQYKEKRARDAAKEAERQKGQRTLTKKGMGVNGDSGNPREESMVILDADGAQDSPRPPMVIHSTRSILNEESGNEDNGDNDVEMEG